MRAVVNEAVMRPAAATPGTERLEGSIIEL